MGIPSPYCGSLLHFVRDGRVAGWQDDVLGGIVECNNVRASKRLQWYYGWSSRNGGRFCDKFPVTCHEVLKQLPSVELARSRPVGRISRRCNCGRDGVASTIRHVRSYLRRKLPVAEGCCLASPASGVACVCVCAHHQTHTHKNHRTDRFNFGCPHH